MQKIEDLPFRNDAEGFFTGSRYLQAAEITRKKGKWIYEFFELTDKQQALELADYENQSDMHRWYSQLAEDDRKKMEAKLKAKGKKR